MSRRLENKNVLVGISGSIAAYKTCDVVRKLRVEGADVKVVMTSAAQKFVTPLTLETLTGHEVVTELFPPYRIVKTRHIQFAEWADCILVCPATANVVGKIASGIADDILTTIITASRAPVVFAPAMDYQMVQNPIFMSNCERLESFGYRFIPTEEGELASGAKGPGRLANTPTIIDTVKRTLLAQDGLKGIRVLVTAGPTQESIDPVRYITNHSTGRMGFALAQEAFFAGAQVTLVSGPTLLESSSEIRRIDITTANEMENCVLEEWKDQDVLIMAAAVSDFRPSEYSPQKIKKSHKFDSIILERTEDILRKAAESKGDRIVVGFALETENEIENAQRKLKQKNLDLICVNNPTEEGSAFGSETNKIILIDDAGDSRPFPLMKKWEVAVEILGSIKNLLDRRNGRAG